MQLEKIKAMFYVPKDNEDLNKLLDDILVRNKGNVDILYAMLIGHECAKREATMDNEMETNRVDNK